METMGPIMATAFRELVLSPLEMLSRRADVALLTSSEELAKQASRRMDATQAMTTGHVAAATVIASEVRTRAALFLPLPLAGTFPRKQSYRI